jgi:hypothetical protein
MTTQTNPSSSRLCSEIELDTYRPHAAEQIRRELDRKAPIPNIPLIREWLLACFRYPAEIQRFWYDRGPIPRLSRLRAPDWDLVSPLIGEMHNYKNEMLPTAPPNHDYTGDPLAIMKDIAFVPYCLGQPLVKHWHDAQNAQHPYIIHQLTMTKPKSQGTIFVPVSTDHRIIILSRFPYTGGWHSHVLDHAYHWVERAIRPAPNCEPSVYVYTGPEHGEQLVLTQVADAPNKPLRRLTESELKHACFRPEFIDYDILGVCNYFGAQYDYHETKASDKNLPADFFGRYLIWQHDLYAQRGIEEMHKGWREEPKEHTVEMLNNTDKTHCVHALRRLRVQLNPFLSDDQGGNPTP